MYKEAISLQPDFIDAYKGGKSGFAWVISFASGAGIV